MPETLEGEWSRVTRNAVHLEMRDSYIRDDPGFIAWQQGRTAEAAARYQPGLT